VARARVEDLAGPRGSLRFGVGAAGTTVGASDGASVALSTASSVKDNCVRGPLPSEDLCCAQIGPTLLGMQTSTIRVRLAAGRRGLPVSVSLVDAIPPRRDEQTAINPRGPIA
jgi:hypothetical protein